MVTRIRSNKIITEYGVIPGYVYYKDGKIIAVGNVEIPFDIEIEDENCYVSPGFIDIHIHGAMGYNFGSSEIDGIIKAANYHMEHGTTTLLPTISSMDYLAIYNAIQKINICMKEHMTKSNIFGVHIEGPYFSKKQAGAQNRDVLTNPIKEEYRKLVEDFPGIIKRWSFAPERDANCEFCTYLVSNEIIASMGHSDAIYEEILPAYKAGCKFVTHLYSATSTVTRDKGFRRMGIIETAYLLDDIKVEIIADGKHLPPELIQLIFKIKGEEGICLITDSIGATGTDNQTVYVGNVECIVEDGVCKLPDRSAFAGSVSTADRLIRTCVQDVGIPLTTAVHMMTSTPAKVLGCKKGILKEGYDADIVLFDENIQVEKVIVDGKLYRCRTGDDFK